MGQGRHVVFRCDAGPSLGGGHVMRCLALADRLADCGWQITFAGDPATWQTVSHLAQRPFRRIELDGQTAGADQAAALGAALPASADWLVVDHYGLDAPFEAAARRWAGAVLAIDDIADRRHDCDILLDQTLGRQAGDYADLGPATARFLLGPDYALLRPQFAATRPRALTERQARGGRLERVLVSLGWRDPNGLAPPVVEGLAATDLPLAVDLILDDGAAEAAQLDDRIQALNADTPLTVRRHATVTDMARLMARADLAVGAAGVTSWERCCLGLPALQVVVAPNQGKIARGLAEAGAARRLPDERERLASAVADEVQSLAATPDQLAAMAAAAAQISDGRGSERVAAWLAPSRFAKSGERVVLRALEATDGDRLYDWQCHPETRRYARRPEIPSFEEHRQWLSRILSDPERFAFMIEADEVPAGVIRLDPLEQRPANEPPGHARLYEVSIYLAAERKGAGVARAAVDIAASLFAGAEIWAHIDPENEASRRLFQRQGYQQVTDTWFRRAAAQTA